jgi:hypothetical protein
MSEEFLLFSFGKDSLNPALLKTWMKNRGSPVGRRVLENSDILLDLMDRNRKTCSQRAKVIAIEEVGSFFVIGVVNLVDVISISQR